LLCETGRETTGVSCEKDEAQRVAVAVLSCERDEGGWGCARESRSTGGGVEALLFGKWFTKKRGLNHFPNFNK
jgi:hypothetical protein